MMKNNNDKNKVLSIEEVLNIKDKYYLSFFFFFVKMVFVLNLIMVIVIVLLKFQIKMEI